MYTQQEKQYQRGKKNNIIRKEDIQERSVTNDIRAEKKQENKSNTNPGSEMRRRGKQKLFLRVPVKQTPQPRTPLPHMSMSLMSMPLPVDIHPSTSRRSITQSMSDAMTRLGSLERRGCSFVLWSHRSAGSDVGAMSRIGVHGGARGEGGDCV